jgi:hypothetical protein
VTPDDDKSIVIRITRESVDISFTVNDKSGNSVEDPEIVVEVGQGEMYTYANGERTHAFGARAGDRDVAVSAEAFITSELTLAAADDHDLTVELERKEKQPACSDGIDNDGDGNVDEADGGCVKGFASHDPSSDEFVYDPEDESEELLRHRSGGALTTSRSGVNVLVSSKEDKRTDVLLGKIFNETAKFAIGQINIYLKNRIETSQSGEAFALRIACGPESEDRFDHDNPRTTDIVPDNQSVDGFRTSLVNGMTREYLTDGDDCLITAVHATEVRDEPFGDGNDDVFFYSTEEDGSVTFEWFYEPEEVQ